MDDGVLRDHIVSLLSGGQAFARPEQILKDVPESARTRQAQGFAHTLWDLLEHTRIAQEDILHYALDPEWVSPEWPKGYWPASSPGASKATDSCQRCVVTGRPLSSVPA